MSQPPATRNVPRGSRRRGLLTTLRPPPSCHCHSREAPLRPRGQLPATPTPIAGGTALGVEPPGWRGQRGRRWPPRAPCGSRPLSQVAGSPQSPVLTRGRSPTLAEPQPGCGSGLCVLSLPTWPGTCRLPTLPIPASAIRELAPTWPRAGAVWYWRKQPGWLHPAWLESLASPPHTHTPAGTLQRGASLDRQIGPAPMTLGPTAPAPAAQALLSTNSGRGDATCSRWARTWELHSAATQSPIPGGPSPSGHPVPGPPTSCLLGTPLWPGSGVGGPPCVHCSLCRAPPSPSPLLCTPAQTPTATPSLSRVSHRLLPQASSAAAPHPPPAPSSCPQSRPPPHTVPLHLAPPPHFTLFPCSPGRATCL